MVRRGRGRPSGSGGRTAPRAGAGGRGTEAAERHLCPCRAIRATPCLRGTRGGAARMGHATGGARAARHAGAEPLGPWRRQGSARRPGGRAGAWRAASRAAGPPDAGASAERAPAGMARCGPPDRQARGTGRFRPPNWPRFTARRNASSPRPTSPMSSRPARWPRSRSMPTARCWAALCWAPSTGLIVGDGRVLAVDFKTNAEVPVRPEDVPEGLLRQMGGLCRDAARHLSRARDRHGDPVVANGDAHGTSRHARDGGAGPRGTVIRAALTRSGGGP